MRTVLASPTVLWMIQRFTTALLSFWLFSGLVSRIFGFYFFPLQQLIVAGAEKIR
jgi:hypothetical protein